MSIRFWDLSNMEVINIRNGKRLGRVGDLGINLEKGCITDLYIPSGSKYWGCIGKKGEYDIPFCCVEKFGTDVILVDIDEKKCYIK